MTGKDEKPAGSPRLTARAKRPRDFGAPEPKPSRKVALNDVLRTLQDLVGNELNVTPPSPARSESDNTHDKSEPPPDVPSNTVATIDFDSVLESVSESPSIQEPEPVTEIERRPSSTTPVKVKAVPPEGLQQELPNLEPDIATPSPPEPEPQPTTTASASKDPDLEPIVTELPELEMVAVPAVEPAPVAKPAPDDDHNHTPSDIPVLDDVVEEAGDMALPAETPAVAHFGTASMPPVADARKLAIQVAARLNVDLRKAGKPVLASDVIARLARALEEALAKAGANRDNDALK